VIISTATAFILSILLGNRFLKGRSRLRSKLVLVSDMTPGEGYVSHQPRRNLVGLSALTTTQLRPAGKVIIDGKYHEAAGDNGIFIEKGTTVTITRDEGGILYCKAK
jgi:membrane-bound serine protease (ClpP class)